MGAINDIFRKFAPEYLRRFGGAMPAEHKKVISAIVLCRTEENGTVVYRCEECGIHHQVDRSCGNRHCPQCQSHKANLWLERQMGRMVPGHHFMVTFTVPAELRDFIRSHQRACYAALFAASSDAMKKLCKDPKHIGGDLPGFFGVLHTWGRQLQYHPHIHYVVPGGAFSSVNGNWQRSGERFFLPVHALSPIFRGKFRDRMEKAGLLAEIPKEVWTKSWNVNSQAVGSSEASIKYLAPYVFRVAISNHRIVKVENGKVTFTYRKVGDNKSCVMELEAMEFIRRFLQHVLPTGFMKVRYYGFLSPNSSVSLDEARGKIEIAYGFEVTEPEREAKPKAGFACGKCGSPVRYLFSLPPGRRLESGPSG
jgi:hypothetical protein